MAQSRRPRSTIQTEEVEAPSGIFMIQDWAEHILNSIFDVIVVADGNMKILDANSAIQEVGYTQKEFVGMSILDLTANKDEFAKAFQIVKDDNGIDRQDLRLQVAKKDGTLYYADTSIRKIRTTEVEDYLIVYHNVDDRAKARRALEEQKSIVEQALADADKARKDAEDAKLALEVANKRLEEKQVVTEQQLLQEREFRIQQNKFGIQQRLSLMIGILVGCAILTPYVFRIFYPVDQNMANSTGNALLLLIGALVSIVSGTFNRRQEDKKEGENNG
jgi:PAS domain S-box-containing protein